MTTPSQQRARQKGAGIVETMIGLLIGMIVILVIYNVFALSEGYKRAAVGAADAQSTGLYAQFVLAREIHNAGNGLLDSGIASSVSDLVQCVNNQPAWSNPFLGGPAPIRPTPALIRDGGVRMPG
jgi:type IV pilus assembly protein PilW